MCFADSGFLQRLTSFDTAADRVPAFLARLRVFGVDQKQTTGRIYKKQLHRESDHRPIIKNTANSHRVENPVSLTDDRAYTLPLGVQVSRSQALIWALLPARTARLVQVRPVKSPWLAKSWTRLPKFGWSCGRCWKPVRWTWRAPASVSLDAIISYSSFQSPVTTSVDV